MTRLSPFDEIYYPIAYLDAIRIKVRQDGWGINKALSGHRQVLAAQLGAYHATVFLMLKAIYMTNAIGSVNMSHPQ